MPFDCDPDENNTKAMEATKKEDHSDESLDELESDDEGISHDQKLQNDTQATPQRGLGRPSYIRTGTPGKPKKMYKVKQANLSLALTDPQNVEEALNQSDKELWLKAEYETLDQNGTWILIPRPTDKKILTNHWVFRIKKTQDGNIDRYKARLVEDIHKKKVDYDEVFAPVARLETIRALMTCAVNEEMYVH